MKDEVMGQEPNVGQGPDESANQRVSESANERVGEMEGQGPEAEGQEPEAQTFDAEYVRKLRAEAAQYRKRLRELERTLEEKEEAELSEQERLQRRVAEYEARLAELERERQERTLQYEVKLRASQMGIVDPDAAWRLLDLASIEFDEDGTPLNVDQALQELVKAKPYLRGQPAAAGVSPTNPPRRQQVFTRSQLRDPKFYAEHKDEIMQALREGRIVDDEGG
ncbi:MAG: hypothetical protein GXP39_07965 [Chloroflexi bacterium]|nr:hypothetical protein [Chloroflexota bacterium]